MSVLSLSLCIAPALFAQSGPQTAEAQLRERLRATMLQLRAAEAERAALQAAQAQHAEEKKALSDRLETISRQANEYKQIAQTVDGLKADIARQQKEIAQLREALENCHQTLAAAQQAHAAYTQVVAEVVIGLERLVADRQAKNLTLYQLANEILDRYQKFGLGDALAAREPFIGITRVKLENLVQDYRDRINNERISLAVGDLEAYRERLLKPPPAQPIPSATSAAQ